MAVSSRAICSETPNVDPMRKVIVRNCFWSRVCDWFLASQNCLKPYHRSSMFASWVFSWTFDADFSQVGCVEVSLQCLLVKLTILSIIDGCTWNLFIAPETQTRKNWGCRISARISCWQLYIQVCLRWFWIPIILMVLSSVLSPKCRWICLPIGYPKMTWLIFPEHLQEQGGAPGDKLFSEPN